MQNGFVHPSGTFGKMGMPLSDMIEVIPSIQRLREIARNHNLPIMYTRLSFASDYSDCFDSPLATGLKELKGFIRGTWDADIVDELNPAANEIVMDKTRSTAFWKTQLEEKMAKLGVNQRIGGEVGRITSNWVQNCESQLATLDLSPRTFSTIVLHLF